MYESDNTEMIPYDISSPPCSTVWLKMWSSVISRLKPEYSRAPAMIPINSELYTSFVTSARMIAISGGSKAQGVCCTDSGVVVTAAAIMTITTAIKAMAEVIFFVFIVTPFFYPEHISFFSFPVRILLTLISNFITLSH